MNRFSLFWGMIFLCAAAFSSRAAFSSLYIFGDSISATTTNNATGILTNAYYGKRYSNGRTWVEVLAQRQGLGANSLSTNVWNYSTNNFSFYGNYSPLMVTNVLKFTVPANASNCLFIIWVCNADFVGDLNDYLGTPTGPSDNYTNLTVWTNVINLHLTNHFRAFTNLYFKGVRTIIAPNAVDINWAPQFNANSTSYRSFVRQRIMSFNAGFAAMAQQVQTLCPGLNIVVPDMFSIFDKAVTNAASYGLTNVLLGGVAVDAIDTYGSGISLNGPGTNYIFWDPVSPTAKFGEVLADTAQEALSPPMLVGMTPVNTSNRIDGVNLPVGMSGTVLFATNLSQTTWLTNSTFSATNVTQSVFVNPTNSMRFYSLKFPWQWTWP
jgi:phospholipase/lecithinase/hemolysin